MPARQDGPACTVGQRRVPKHCSEYLHPPCYSGYRWSAAACRARTSRWSHSRRANVSIESDALCRARAGNRAALQQYRSPHAARNATADRAAVSVVARRTWRTRAFQSRTTHSTASARGGIGMVRVRVRALVSACVCSDTNSRVCIFAVAAALRKCAAGRRRFHCSSCSYSGGCASKCER